MNIGILGSGQVAQALAIGFAANGHPTKLGTRDTSKLADWEAENPSITLGSVADAAAFGDVLVLAVKGLAASKVLRSAGAENLAGKPILDATNPIADAPPVNGVLPLFTSVNSSLMEQLQAEFPTAHLVKCFSSVGADQFVNPTYSEGRPTMFICGNNDAAKAITTQLLDQFGWETADMGKAESARAIEPLCILWCIPGFLHNEWTHAFKLLHLPSK